MLRKNGYNSFKLHGETDFFECWRKFNIQEHMDIDSTFSTSQVVGSCGFADEQYIVELEELGIGTHSPRWGYMDY